MSSGDMEERIAYLKAENAKLLEEFDKMDIWYSKELLYAISENDRLRELVRFIMHQCNEGDPRCDECIGRNDGECVVLQRMRELGVEVS